MSPTPFAYFERTYVINLPHRTDRRRETEAELQRFAAPQARIVWLAATQDSDPHGFPSAGAYGCFQSHARALREARQDGLSNVLVLEDDILISSRLLEVWPVIERTLSTMDWDIVSLGYPADHPPGDDVGEALVRFDTEVTMAHCYAINGRALATFTDFLSVLEGRERGHPDGGKMHFDGAINVFIWQHPDAVRLCSRENLVQQRSSRSDIATPSWADRAPVPDAVVSRLRSLKNVVRRRSI